MLTTLQVRDIMRRHGRSGKTGVYTNKISQRTDSLARNVKCYTDQNDAGLLAELKAAAGEENVRVTDSPADWAMPGIIVKCVIPQ